MFRKRSPSNRVSSFRPTLEVLEDRTLPSAVFDMVYQFGKQALSNVATGELLILKVNSDVAAFNSNPSAGNFISLLVDSVHLNQVGAQVAQQVGTFNAVVGAAVSFGGVSGFEKTVLDTTLDGAITEAKRLVNAGDEARANALQLQ